MRSEQITKNLKFIPGVFPIDEHEDGGIEGWQEDGEEDFVEKILLKEMNGGNSRSGTRVVNWSYFLKAWSFFTCTILKHLEPNFFQHWFPILLQIVLRLQSFLQEICKKNDKSVHEGFKIILEKGKMCIHAKDFFCFYFKKNSWTSKKNSCDSKKKSFFPMSNIFMKEKLFIKRTWLWRKFFKKNKSQISMPSSFTR